MKRKQILAKAITLGLLLAMPCSAWAETLNANTDYSNGLSVNSGTTLNGAGHNINVTGTTQDSENNTYSVINQGTIENVGTLTAERIKNKGCLEVNNLQTTGDTFLNDGKGTIATVGGGNISCESPSWPYNIDGGIFNDNGAKLHITGDVYNAGFFKNHNGSVINIDNGVIVTAGKIGGFDNKATINGAGANLKLEKDVVTGAESNYSNKGYLNVKVLESQNDFENNGSMVVQDKILLDNNLNTISGIYNLPGGVISFMGNNNEPIQLTNVAGSTTLTNKGAIYVVSGTLNLNKIRIDIKDNNACFKKSETEKLDVLTTNMDINLDGESTLEVEREIKAAALSNSKGKIKTNTLEVKQLTNKSVRLDKYQESKVEVNKLVFSDNVSNGDNPRITSSGVKFSGGTIIVHESIEYNGEDEGKVENYGYFLFDGNQGANIGNNIIVDNKVHSSSGEEFTGLIAKNADGDRITNLTIEGTLNNNGIVAAETLNVANGADGSKTQASKGFDVDTLNILDGGSFALNNTEYVLQNVGVGTNAELTAAGAINGAETVVLADAANFATQSLSMTAGGAVTSDGGSLTTNAMNGESLTFNLQSGKEKQINVEEKFTGGDLKINVVSLTPAQVVINQMTGSGITINGNSDITDSFASDNIEAGLQSLAYTASINEQDGDQSRKVASAAGKILGPTEAMTDAKNKIIKSSVKEKVNPANQGISEMASIALMTWRQENNDMNKRLGELRDSAGEHGVWVRMTRGEAKYGNQNIKNQYNAYQLGYDEKLSSDKHWTVGAALTYTDAESSFSYGKGENKHKGLAIYGSRLNDDGSFIDIIARYARLEHEYEVYGGAGKGDFDTNGYSLSAEYGKRFTQDNGLWIEPQVELTYGRVSSSEYLTNNGVRVRQEGMDSLVGRLGFALGKNLAQGKGKVYLRASYLYDFDGETDVRYSCGQQNKRFEQDLGGGWWEVGVGTNINLSEASHLYFDVEKTYGGDVATPWQWNAGVRWSF